MMSKTIRVLSISVNIFILSFVFTVCSFANNLSISNIEMQDRNPTANTLQVSFDLTWDNSWKTKINYDAIWVTVRLHDPAVLPVNKKLCKATYSGLNPVGTFPGVGANLEIFIPEDRNGVFVRPSTFGLFSSVSATGVQVTIDYTTCGFDDADEVFSNVMGIEMTLIPEGAFYAGDFTSSIASFAQGSADLDPWYISSANSLNTSNVTNDGFRYVSNGKSGEDASGSSFVIPSVFPKGYTAFYIMKYEVTEGQWVEFFNSLPSAGARANRDLTNSSHKNSDLAKDRNTISCSGSPLTCATQRPARALNYLSWSDLTAFLDWVSLRPLTELEFEKAARGPLLPNASEFAWGTANIVPAQAISGILEDGSESVATSLANANFGNFIFSGGDASMGTDYDHGPMRSGIFATASTNRETAGSGYYGVFELSGNLAERVVTVGNITGRNFEGTHGDGILTTATGSEGFATAMDWPGIDLNVENGVTSATGSGFRGGNWQDDVTGARLRISDRNDAANGNNSAFATTGGRGARTYVDVN